MKQVCNDYTGCEDKDMKFTAFDVNCQDMTGMLYGSP